jgi:hypothetical protein
MHSLIGMGDWLCKRLIFRSILVRCLSSIASALKTFASFASGDIIALKDPFLGLTFKPKLTSANLLKGLLRGSNVSKRSKLRSITRMNLHTLNEFRHGMYHCFGNAKDALFNLVDALASEAAVGSFPELSCSPFFERSWASLYEALEDGQIDVERLRQLFVDFAPLPEAGATGDAHPFAPVGHPCSSAATARKSARTGQRLSSQAQDPSSGDS